MTLRVFRNKLKELGYDLNQIMELNRLGYHSALDAHAGAENEIPNFNDYCLNIGRDFVLENLEMFDEMLKR